MSGTVTAYFKHGHGDNPVVLRTVEDADALVDALLNEEFDNSVAALYSNARPEMDSGYPDHELRVAIFAEANVGGIRYAGDDGASPGTWYVPGRKSQRDEVFYLYMTHDESWPRNSEVSIDDVRAAVKEFVANGGDRPASFEWVAWPTAPNGFKKTYRAEQERQ
jgi:Immunity protein Imm1